MIGAPYADEKAGESHVIFGRVFGFDAEMSLSNLNGTNGFLLTGEMKGDQSGWSVSDAGDVNSDGIDDLLIGAPYAGNSAGKSYVVLGYSVSSAGDVNGDKVDDVIIGAPYASTNGLR